MLSSFTVSYVPLREERAAFGSIAVIPWDSDIFGFPVAGYQLGDPEAIVAEPVEFRMALSEWVSRYQVRLVSCFVPAEDLRPMPVLTGIGFSFVELGLTASIANLQRMLLDEPRGRIRAGAESDRVLLERIAEGAFRSGRYAADPLLPPEFSAKRYVCWVRDALSGDPRNRLYVMGDAGQPTCFFHLVQDGDAADLRLAAVRPDLQGGPLGYRLYQAVLFELQRNGVKRVSARCSATNTPVVNLYAKLGFHFAHPDVILHWHPR
jgi:GNAT superfamily N-acetyltransferase